MSDHRPTRPSARMERLQEHIATHCQANAIPGYVAGIYEQGEESVAAHGLANLATGAPMHQDTGFLFGSITKLLTTTLVLRLVERGAIDLEARVVDYLPELAPTSPSAAEDIRVRHLLSHTSGIDADLFFTDVQGPNALEVHVKALGRHCGSLFDAGAYASYSNGGMIVAGRVAEVVTGTPYPELLAREVYAPVGMANACTSADRAILRSTAVGHFFDPSAGRPKRTDLFMLPDSWGPAGSTPVGTIGDLLAFARTHLAHGRSPSGQTVLSRESALRMQQVAHAMGTPNSPPLGLGWVLMPFGATTVLSHSGSSPGGVAVLAVIPEKDVAFAAFGNDPRAMALHERNLLWLLRELEVEVPRLVPDAPAPPLDLHAYAGTYRSNQLRIDVTVADGGLEERITYEPLDDQQRRIFSGFSGGDAPYPQRRFVPAGTHLFAPAGLPLETFDGYSRQMLVSYHGMHDGRATYRCAGGRMTRRAG